MLIWQHVDLGNMLIWACHELYVTKTNKEQRYTRQLFHQNFVTLVIAQ